VSTEDPFTLTVEDEPSQDDVATIGRRLYEFNRQIAGEDHHRLLAVFLRDETGTLVAGLTGGTFWGWLVIDLLWVGEVLRGQGIGGRLLEAAEQEAIRRGCTGAFLDTLDFQAPAFYRERGYAVFGVLPGLPPGHTRYYLAKRFDVTSGDGGDLEGRGGGG
jgi:GNAT superfamily N-acetyltransferase